MTATLYRTSDMEQALRVMTERNHQVLALMEYRARRIIRLRPRSPKLQGVQMLFCQSWRPETHGQIDRWQSEGKVLLYRPGPSHFPTHPACDALLFVECPLQYDWLETRIANVRQEAVVYRPPSWDLHEEAMDHKWPRRCHYETMESVLASLVTRNLSPRMQAARELMPHWTKFAIFDDNEMESITGWDQRMIRSVLRFKYNKASIRFPVFHLRYVPRESAAKWGYDVLAAQPSVGKKLHVLKGDHPFEGQRPSFKTQLAVLLRRNYIAREGNIYMVNMDRPGLNLDRIDAIHNMHRGKWFKVRNFVDSLQEYPI